MLVVLVAGVAGAAFWFLGDDPPEELSVEDAVGAEDAAPADDGLAGEEGTDLGGTWAVAAGGESQAGLRITESFVGGLADHDIEEPSTPSIADVADEGRFEFLVVLERAG